MADWPRTLLPQKVTDFEVPGPLIQRGQSGKYSLRSTGQIGRIWRETYLVKMSSDDGKQLLATARWGWRNGIQFNIDHRDYLTPRGAGGGSPVVAGASQTGSLLVVDGMASGAGYLYAGDIFSIAGIDNIFEVVATVSVPVGGTATITINPPIFAGGSPSNNAVLTITSVKLKAYVVEPPDMPETDASDYGYITITFGEAV